MDRRRIWFVVRLAFTATLLVIVLFRTDFENFLPRWTLSTFLWLAAGLLVTLVGIVLSALRWRTVLHALGVEADTRSLLSHYLASLFIGNFLLSTIGGDVLRVWRLSNQTGERPACFASVVLERLTGWIVLPAISLAALALNPGLRRLGTATALAVAIAVGTLVLLVAILAIAASRRLGGRLADNPGWLRFVGAVHLGIDRFRRHPGSVASVLAVGFAYQLAVVLAAFLGAKALELGTHVSITAMLAFMPAVAIAQVVPITVGGLGLRENALVIFLGPLGVPHGRAFALGLLVYGMNLVVSLLGAPAFALHRGPTEAAPT